jgi:hypothetical protein
MSTEPVYARIAEGDPLPDISVFAPFRAVVSLDADYSRKWQDEVAKWLVGSGCLYMMAWGANCAEFHDTVDWANIDQFAPNEVPDDRLVMTTWHDKETLEDVLWFAQTSAHHGDVDLDNTLIVDVRGGDRKAEILRMYLAASDTL